MRAMCAYALTYMTRKSSRDPRDGAAREAMRISEHLRNVGWTAKSK
mgnify:CR=1 FL=1